MTKKLYVGNLPWSATEGEVQEAFEKYGEVKSVLLIKDKLTQKPRGFGFIEMDGADEAMDALNESDFGGRSLTVNEAKERAPRPASMERG